MDKIEKWGKEAYRRGLDLEDLLEKNTSDINTLKSNVSALDTAVSELEEGGNSSEGEQIFLRSIYSGKLLCNSTTATSRFVCDIESEANSYAELDITFGICSSTVGTSGNALVEILLDEDVICSKAVVFMEVENQIDIKRFIYSKGTQKLYIRCTCLSVDESENALPFYIKDATFTLRAKQAFIMEDGYSTVVEQVPSISTARTSNVYFFNIDGIGLHCKEYNPSTGVTTILDSASTGRCGVGLLTDVDYIGTLLIQYVDTNGNYIVYPACWRHYTTNDSHTQQIPALVTTTLLPGVSWENYTLTELVNSVNLGVAGLNCSPSLQYRALVMGYPVGETTIKVQGVRMYLLTTADSTFDLDCPFENVKRFYNVSHIWNNTGNYSAMVIFQDNSDDLYIQAYNIQSNPASPLVDWLDKVDACTKVGNGTRCTAHYENGLIRFYYIRDRKIYSTTLTLSTRELSAETYIAEGQYYKECEGCYVLRNNGVITYVEKE